MQSESGEVIHLLAETDRAKAERLGGSVWSLASAELNVNLVQFSRGDGVARHTNTEVDVVLIIVEGKGIVEMNGTESVVTVGDLVYVPKGTARSTRALGETFTYLTCHRRRAGIMPTRMRR